MTTTIRQMESLPDAYPTAPSGLSTAAAALSAEMVWQRIEAYTAHRWTERDVTWVVEGPGEWFPPLTPATIATVDVWSGADEWQTAELAPSPLGGYVLTGCGPYRFVGTVGDDEADVPAAITESFRRLAEYMAGKLGKPGAYREQISAGSISLVHSRAASWMAQAMQNSGAGDLLRPYRRAA